jgi:hypothetical protein
MQMIRTSLDSIPKRQTFVLFLVTHRHICEKCKVEQHDAENKLSFLKNFSLGDEMAQYGIFGSYPKFSVNIDPQSPFTDSIITFTATEEKPSVLGYEKATLSADAILAHEFRHGYHIPLGGHDYSRYIIDYLKNPFMKELLFNDFDQIQVGIKQSLFASMNGLSDEDVAQFVEQVKSHFGLSSSGTPSDHEETPDFLKVTSEVSDRQAFIGDLSEKLALIAINSIWDDPEEIQNIIGVQVVGKTLFVNMLSDLDASVADGKTVRWTHLGTDKEFDRKNLLSKEKIAALTNPVALLFITDFYAKYSILADAPLNHPTPNALKALEILHGVTGLI